MKKLMYHGELTGQEPVRWPQQMIDRIINIDTMIHQMKKTIMNEMINKKK